MSRAAVGGGTLLPRLLQLRARCAVERAAARASTSRTMSSMPESSACPAAVNGSSSSSTATATATPTATPTPDANAAAKPAATATATTTTPRLSPNSRPALYNGNVPSAWTPRGAREWEDVVRGNGGLSAAFPLAAAASGGGGNLGGNGGERPLYRGAPAALARRHDLGRMLASAAAAVDQDDDEEQEEEHDDDDDADADDQGCFRGGRRLPARAAFGRAASEAAALRSGRLDARQAYLWQRRCGWRRLRGPDGAANVYRRAAAPPAAAGGGGATSASSASWQDVEFEWQEEGDDVSRQSGEAHQRARGASSSSSPSSLCPRSSSAAAASGRRRLGPGSVFAPAPPDSPAPLFRDVGNGVRFLFDARAGAGAVVIGEQDGNGGAVGASSASASAAAADDDNEELFLQQQNERLGRWALEVAAAYQSLGDDDDDEEEDDEDEEEVVIIEDDDAFGALTASAAAAMPPSAAARRADAAEARQRRLAAERAARRAQRELLAFRGRNGCVYGFWSRAPLG